MAAGLLLAHVRRCFVKRFENALGRHDLTRQVIEGSPIAKESAQIALGIVLEPRANKVSFYQVEKTVRGKEPSLRIASRCEHSAPVVAALKPWLEAQLSRIPQKANWPRPSATRWRTGRG